MDPWVHFKWTHESIWLHLYTPSYKYCRRMNTSTEGFTVKWKLPLKISDESGSSRPNALQFLFSIFSAHSHCLQPVWWSQQGRTVIAVGLQKRKQTISWQQKDDSFIQGLSKLCELKKSCYQRRTILFLKKRLLLSVPYWHFFPLYDQYPSRRGH